MEKEELKREVGKVLISLQDINEDEVSDNNGRLDFDKLKENQKVITAINQLKKWGITRTYLSDNFFIASMVLGHLL